MSVQEFVVRRGIRSALHFTTNRGLVGVLASRALLSRQRLSEDKYLEHVLHVNSAYRAEDSAVFDKSENWIDYVNLSISEINSRFLRVSRRWHRASSVWWCILDFDSSIMAHSGVYFATTNNSYHSCTRARGADGLQALFVDCVERNVGWSASRGNRATHLPTCEQAEILYPQSVATDYLRRIYVQSDEHHDIVGGWLQDFCHHGVQATVALPRFEGVPN